MMMNAALFLKTARDQMWLTLIISIVLLLFPVVILTAFSSVPAEMIETAFQVPWIGTLIRALTGADISQLMNVNTVGAFAFVHPVVLTITWGFVVTTTSRLLCGELDRGTADLLLSLPLSRWTVYSTLSLWVLLCCPLMAGCLWCGVALGARIAGMADEVSVWELRYVALNSACLLCSVTGIGMLASAAGSRRGRVVGSVVAVLVLSFLLNSLAVFWPAAGAISFLSIMRYFRPFAIVLEQRMQTTDVSVLLGVTAITWAIGGIIFSRRDIEST